MKSYRQPKLIIPLVTMVMLAAAVAIALSGSFIRSLAAAPSGLVALPGSVPPEVATAQLLGPYQGQQLSIELSLAVNHQAQLNTLLNEISNPQSKQYHHWLTPTEYDKRFGPTPAQITAAKNFLTGAGLTLVPGNSSPFFLQAQGSLGTVEAAFHVSINNYRSSDGQTFFANSTNPLIPASLKGIIIAVLGLDDVPRVHPA